MGRVTGKRSNVGWGFSPTWRCKRLIKSQLTLHFIEAMPRSFAGWGLKGYVLIGGYSYRYVLHAPRAWRQGYKPSPTQDGAAALSMTVLHWTYDGFRRGVFLSARGVANASSY